MHRVQWQPQRYTSRGQPGAERPRTRLWLHERGEGDLDSLIIIVECGEQVRHVRLCGVLRKAGVVASMMS